MAGSIKDYRNMVEQPWGKMFYDLVFRQLNIQNDKRLKILDFGAGFCLTADHYAKCHDVIAVEPNKEMYDLRVNKNDYKLVEGGIDYLQDIKDSTFDVVICHNVLEYTADKEIILKHLVRVLKTDGLLSIVKHNELGKVMAFAVLNDNPKEALEILSKENDESSIFGNRDVYSNEYLVNYLVEEMALKVSFGIRTFFGLSSNNEIKSTDEWYQSMLELETKASNIDEYKKIAFFNHLIFKKI